LRFADVIRIAVSALLRTKSRTILTMSGVVIGSYALVVILAMGQGFETAITKQLSRGDQIRHVLVNPGFGEHNPEKGWRDVELPDEMSEQRRERIRQTVRRRRGMGGMQRARTVPLTTQLVDELRKLPGVESVRPLMQDRFHAVMEKHSSDVLSFSTDTKNSRLDKRIIAGKFFETDTGNVCIVHEYLLYRWGIIRDDDVPSVIGKKIRLEGRGGGGSISDLLDLVAGDLTADEKKTAEALVKRLPGKLPEILPKLELTPAEILLLAKLRGKLPKDTSDRPATAAEEFTIVGVLREFMEDDDVSIFEAGLSMHADIYLPQATAERLFFGGSRGREDGYTSLMVTAKTEEDAREITRDARKRGLLSVSMGSIVDEIRKALSIVTMLTAFLAAIALLVAALGIINTLIMSVLERTREIGIMKAVGARDASIQGMFLVESALIGFLGGSTGLLLGRLSAFPAEAAAKAWIFNRTQAVFHEPLFLFPWWLWVGAPVFATLVSIVAAVYPARRAAKVNPIVALRHE